MPRLAFVVAGVLYAAGLPLPAAAAIRLHAAVGLDPSDHGDTRVVRLAVSGDWSQRWFTGGHWYVTPHWTLSAGHWDSSETGSTGIDRLGDVGVRVGVRLLRKGPGASAVRPYLDAGTGVHYLTERAIDDRQLGSHGLFGTMVGAGIVFGDHEQYELGWCFLHLSNAELEHPNDGINFNLVQVGYRFP